MQRECVLQFVQGTPNQEKERIYIQYGLTPVYHSLHGGFERVVTPLNRSLIEVIGLLNLEPSVLSAEPNYIAKADIIPNDPLFRYQWNMLQIKADQAWNTNNGVGVTIAVLDSGAAFENFGIYAQAPDLAGTTFVPGWDFVNSDANPDDDYGHGTHITGTIAQTTNNFLGCAGVAFGASIMPVKVLDNTGAGSLTNVVDGIYFAANNGAKIINMSFGFGNNPSLTLQNAVNYANSVGCLMICSAGNYGNNLPNYPSSYPSCISVSATIYDQTLASYSNYGLDIDLCAPGGDLTLDQNLDGYPDGILQQSHDGVDFTVFDYFAGKGTSWSAAHVSAVAAMVASAGGTAMTPLAIRNILESTAVDLGTPGWDESFGWGMVDASAALLAVQQGATVLTASPLLPFSPLSFFATPLPVAAIAGYSIPVSFTGQPDFIQPPFNPLLENFRTQSSFINNMTAPLPQYMMPVPSQTLFSPPLISQPYNYNYNFTMTAQPSYMRYLPIYTPYPMPYPQPYFFFQPFPFNPFRYPSMFYPSYF